MTATPQVETRVEEEPLMFGRRRSEQKDDSVHYYPAEGIVITFHVWEHKAIEHDPKLRQIVAVVADSQVPIKVGATFICRVEQLVREEIEGKS